jgi:hypothetical protein
MFTTPVFDKRSSQIIAASITPYIASSNISNSNDWGIPIYEASSTDKTYFVKETTGWFGDAGIYPFKIPGAAKPSIGSDHHMVVIDRAKNAELNLWAAEFDGTNWSAGTRSITPIG